MGVNIHLKPTEVWPFFSENKARLENEMVAIAENEETCHSVYLTEENGCPLLSVYKEDTKLYEEGAVSAADSELTTKQIYLKYLFPVVVHDTKYSFQSDLEEDEEEITAEMEMQMMEDEIYEREDALTFAMQDFLEVVLNCNSPSQITELYGKDIIEELLDSFCMLLAEEHLISVYRPTFVTDEETGEESYVEYPYLDVDDEGTTGAMEVTRK